jgi:hypothetical protein
MERLCVRLRTIDGWQKIAGVVSCHGLAGGVTIAM